MSTAAPPAGPAVEFGLSTSMLQGDLDRLPLLSRFPATHVEIGFYPAAHVETVVDHVRRLGLAYGFHDPLPWQARWRWPSLTDPDPRERARSLEVLDATLETVARHGARYALAHFPSVHFEPVAGWSRARLLEVACAMADRLDGRAAGLGVPILLENVGPNPYWDAAAWCEVLAGRPNLAFCLDVGHLHLETGGDGAANLAFVTALAPHTRQVHLYNATLESYRTWHHVPAHPEQDPGDGWIDLPAVLAALSAGRRGPLRIIFEHTPEYDADERFVREGMDWVRAQLGG